MNLPFISELIIRVSNKIAQQYPVSLLALANSIHSEQPLLRRLTRTLRFCFNGIRYRQEFDSFHKVFDSPELTEVAQLCPAILEKPFSPYVLADWSQTQRFTQLQDHFLFLKELFGERVAEIYKPSGYTIFDFNCHENEHYSVELFPGYQSEGSIGIRLCDNQRREVYSLSLHLSNTAQRACYIGALQGPNDRIPERQKTIVSLTRGLYGLRPKALMLEALYMIASSLRIEVVYGVSNSGNIYNASVYANKKIESSRFDRDQMWREYHAESTTACLFKFPKEPIRKDISLLKPNKRSMYRKRYSWLLQMRSRAEESMNRLLVDGVDIVAQLDEKQAA